MEIINSNGDIDLDAAIQNFNIGTRVQLRNQRDEKPVEHFSSLIGLVKDEFLLVKCPIERNAPFVFYDDEEVLVRAFTGTMIYTFTSTVMRTFLSPLYYMHLAYPRMVTRSALRSALRVKVRLPASVEYANAGGVARTVEVNLVNLSLSGAAIEAPEVIPVGQTLAFSFAVNLDGVERVIRTQAIVRSVNFRPAGRGQEVDVFSCGVQFKDMVTDDQTAIRLLTYEKLLADRQNIA
ncbi:MAG: flagellar brake protein [Herminiimonas sp.]|nr:flagellar brake protein [Herminiimonas sp.]